MAGGLGDAGPADDAAVRAWASQLRAVAAKRSPPAAAGVAVGLAGRVAATGRVSPKLAARLVFGSFVLLSTALVAPERAAVAKRQKRVPAVVIARQLAIAAGAAVVASIAPTRRSAVALAVLAALARWARGGEDGFAARVATKAAELRASRATCPTASPSDLRRSAQKQNSRGNRNLAWIWGAWGPRFKRTAAPGAFGPPREFPDGRQAAAAAGASACDPPPPPFAPRFFRARSGGASRTRTSRIEPAIARLDLARLLAARRLHRLELRRLGRERGGRCKRRGDGGGESELHRRAAVDGGGLHLRGLQGRGRAEEEGREELHVCACGGSRS